MNKAPLVSVVIPTYRRSDYLADALESLKKQTYDHFEAFVVNDDPAGRQAVDRVLSRFDDDRFRVLHHRSSQGGNAARNTGLAHAKGALIAFLDDDDAWFPERLEQHARKHVDNPAVGVVYSDRVLYWEDEALPSRVGRSRFPSEGALAAMRTGSFCPPLVSGSIRKECFDRCGTFDERLRAFQDWDLWFRIAHHYGFVRLAEPLNVFRQHYGERTSTAVENRLQGLQQIVQKWRGEIDVQRLCATYEQATHYRYVQELMLQGKRVKAFKAVRRLIGCMRAPGDAIRLLKLIAALSMGRTLYSFLLRHFADNVWNGEQMPFAAGPHKRRRPVWREEHRGEYA